MAKFCATVYLDLPPTKANARRHWALQRRLESDWAKKAAVMLANTRQRPHRPLARFKAHVTVITKRASDLDNCSSRTKKVWDTLRHLGWIEDDSPRHMVELTVVNKVSQKTGIEVHLCEH